MKTTFKCILLLTAFIICGIVGVNSQTINYQASSNQQTSYNIFSKNAKINNGFWTASIEKNEIGLLLTNQAGSRNPGFVITTSFPKNIFTPIAGGNGYEIIRESGTLSLMGTFSETEGSGKFTFTSNEQFIAFLERNRIDTNVEDIYLFKAFLGNLNKDFVNGIKERGYDSTLKELTKLTTHGATLNYIDELAAAGYKGLELNMISKFAIHDITIEYIQELSKAGYSKMDPNMLKKFAIHDIRIDYIKELNALGYGNLSPEMLKKFAVHQISPKYIKGLSSVGFDNLDSEMLKKFKVHNISATYIKSLQDLNLERLSAQTIKKAKVHNVSAAYVKNARSNGYVYTSLSDYIRLKIRGEG